MENLTIPAPELSQKIPVEIEAEVQEKERIASVDSCEFEKHYSQQLLGYQEMSLSLVLSPIKNCHSPNIDLWDDLSKYDYEEQTTT